MVEITYSLENNKVKLLARGHAQFAIEGKDIVCSAISAILIGGINSLEEFDSFNIKIEKGYILVESLDEVSESNKTRFEVIYTQLATVQDQFPEYLKLIRRE